MSESQTFFDALVEAIRQASVYNKNDQIPPIVVLWTDEDQQWQALLPQLRTRLPLLTFDHERYAPEERRGPAYWLRCMLAGSLAEDHLPENETPIIYLPGVGKADLRAVEECPKPLQSLAELQHRGALWTQRNGRDWTIASFLQNKEGGLGIAVGADQATKEAMLQALPKLAREPLARLRQAAPLKAPFFYELLNPDAVRRLLLWLNAPGDYPQQISPAEWHSFCSLCQQKYGFHPEKDGPVTAGQLLGEQKGEWPVVWQRFLEAPEAYPQLPALLAQARPVQLSLFAEPLPYWPQDTQTAENKLRDRLKQLRHETAPAARTAIVELEKEHGPRREWVWAKLSQSPLAMALEYLTLLAEMTEKSLTGSSVAQLAQAYTEWGWQVDSAVLSALAAVAKAEDVMAVKAAILPLYRPWLETAAGSMQKLAAADMAPFRASGKLPAMPNGSCILFCDALRFDVARRLQDGLTAVDLEVMIDWRIAALPTVTATAKPAISPVAAAIIGGQPNFEPVTKATGAVVNIYNLRKLLQEAGYQVLAADDLGDPGGKAWTELGAIDQYGHQNGWKIAHHVGGELAALQERVQALLHYGWKQVVIVTDHGWLLLPDGLPKVELPLHLTLARKGRCAILKEGSSSDQQVVPWHWAETVHMAVATGIGCYEAGKEYDHGGISPQECIVPLMVVTAPVGDVELVMVTAVMWRGLRSEITLSGDTGGLRVDIRTKAGDANTSVVSTAKAPKADGVVSLVVPDEDRAGEAALVVVVNEKGLVRAQKPTIIGEV